MKLARRLAWILVVAAALAISNWSLAYVARSWGVPGWLPWIVSAVFDGVALLCADLALKAARLGDSTFAPSAGLLIFGGASAAFNSYHAQLAGLPAAAWVFYAFPPLAALAAVELQLRHDRRSALREAGRIAEPLPAFGGATWLNLPWSTYRAQREIMAYRQTSTLAAATPVRVTAWAEPEPEQRAELAASAARLDPASPVKAARAASARTPGRHSSRKPGTGGKGPAPKGNVDGARAWLAEQRAAGRQPNDRDPGWAEFGVSRWTAGILLDEPPWVPVTANGSQPG